MRDPSSPERDAHRGLVTASVMLATLMQAVDVLFDHRDDSRREEIRRTKPVDRDVGSEVEADIQIGPYEFTYFKRFHKGRETRLVVRTKAPSSALVNASRSSPPPLVDRSPHRW